MQRLITSSIKYNLIKSLYLLSLVITLTSSKNTLIRRRSILIILLIDLRKNIRKPYLLCLILKALLLNI
jgi:hypothetical protein